MEIERVGELLGVFRKKKILVIGDVMLDQFIWGRVSRISPEAPVPVVEVTDESAYPGGAANVARNLKEFCNDAYVMGVVGNDRHGLQLRQIMVDMGLDLRCLFDGDQFKTIVKTRILARQQQMVRVDREQRLSPDEALIQSALKCLAKILPQVDAVIFEDYAKGLLSQDFVARASRLIAKEGKILTADPNPKNPLTWKGLTAIKPNRTEAFRCADVEENEPEADFTSESRLPEVSRRLLEKWSATYLLITLGENGMVLFERDAEPYHIPTRAQEVYDVSGAGDTAIALFTLALAAGATAREAAEISNHASSVVVGKLGTATLTPAELLASFERLPRQTVTKNQFPFRSFPVAKPAKKKVASEESKSPSVERNAMDPNPSNTKKVIGRKKRRPNPEPARSPHVKEPYKVGAHPRRRSSDIPMPAVFLDRDGTLMEEVEYCGDPKKVRVFPAAPNSLYRLKIAGFLNVIITNQSGIGRGYFSESDFEKVHHEFLLQAGWSTIDATYVCADHPDKATERRKPGIGMIQEAAADLNIDLSRSWFIGDKASDILCGQRAGLRTILVTTGYGLHEDCKPDYRARDIASAVDWIVIG